MRSGSRIVVIAPHPDDEVIGAGGLIQRAIARGGEVCAVFITAGEANPWPQRVMRRKWLVTPADRAAWGSMRQKEAAESMDVLGVKAAGCHFLGFPDQQMATLARQGDQRLTDALRGVMREYQTSLLVAPSAQDFHADHRAVAWYAHHAVRGLGDNAPEIITYVVHGEGARSRLHLSLKLSDREREQKRKAIECHRSQLLLSRERFLAYARSLEEFYAPEFDLVCTESRARERVGAFRHSCRVLFGRAKPGGREEPEHITDPATDPEVR